MIVSLLLLLQAGTLTVDRDVREKYLPYRQCLVEQGRPLAGASRTDEEIIDQARGKCLASNLGSGSAALFALMRTGATKEQAIERGARLREETEREALAILRATPGERGEAVAVPSTSQYRMARLAIPGEIAPAIRPYMQCLSAPKDADCKAQRAKAAADADRMLRRRGGRNKEERRALIETTLAEVASFHRRFALTRPRGGTDAQD